MKRSLGLTILPLAVLALSACGLRGDLERPPPLWGNPPIQGPDDPRLQQNDESEPAEATPQPSPTVEDPSAAEPGEPVLDADTPVQTTPQ